MDLFFSLLLNCAKYLLTAQAVSELGISCRDTFHFSVPCICNNFFFVHPSAIMSAVNSIILSLYEPYGVLQEPQRLYLH